MVGWLPLRIDLKFRIRKSAQTVPETGLGRNYRWV